MIHGRNVPLVSLFLNIKTKAKLHLDLYSTHCFKNVIRRGIMPPKFKRHLRSGDLVGSKEVERVNLLGEYHDEEEEEDFFYDRSPVPKPGASNQGDPKIQKVQGQVDEVIGVMRNNMEKVIDRGEKLEDLEDKTEDLMFSASIFKVSAKGLRSHFWWQQCKMRILMLVVVIIILLIVFIPIILKTRNK